MKKLINGIVQFRKTSLASYREKFSKLAYEQSPDTFFIACSDSRVVPNVFASTDPGDLFVLRNIGNLIPAYCKEGSCSHHDVHTFQDTSASAGLEFSLLALKATDIVVCGHSDCGAMRFLLENPSQQAELPFLKAWLKNAMPSYERFIHSSPTPTLSEVNALSQINVLQQLDHLRSYPWVKERLEKNQLRLHGWWFDLETADVYYYDVHEDAFILIDEDHAQNLLASL